jgi:hypothetical protein
MEEPSQCTCTANEQIHGLHGSQSFYAKFTKASFRTLPGISSLQSSLSIISCVYIPSVVWSLEWHSFQIVIQFFISFPRFPLFYSVHLTVRCFNLFEVFEAVMRWVKRDSNVRKKDLPKLLATVRLPLLTPQYLTDRVAVEELIRTSHECR